MSGWDSVLEFLDKTVTPPPPPPPPKQPVENEPEHDCPVCEAQRR